MFNRIIKGIEKRLEKESDVRQALIDNDMSEYIPTLDLAKERHEKVLKLLKPFEVVELVD